MVTTPLPGSNPFGENINFDASFETIKSEIGKLGGIDFVLIEDLCVRLIREKSKDIRLMVFVSLVYLRNENWESFADLFQGLAQLAENNFDNLFPERPNARLNAFRWLGEQRYVDALANKKPDDADLPHIQRLVAALNSIQKTLEPLLPAGESFAEALLRTAQSWNQSVPIKPKTETIAPAASVIESPKQAIDAVRKSALFLIEREPAKPTGYRLLRLCRWEGVEKTPSALNNKTPLTGPNLQQIRYCDGLLVQKDWPLLLKTAQTTFASGANHLWLDLQRFSTLACQALGSDYQAVQDAICQETARFLQRLPDLINLTFTDDVPFCTIETRTWITSFAKTDSPTHQAGAGSALEEAAEAISSEWKAVEELVAGGRMEAAIELLHDAIRGSRNERDNFRRSIRMGELLQKKQPEIALSILESLAEKIDEYHLDKWDPELALDALAAHYRTLAVCKSGKSGSSVPALHEQQRILLGRISRLNPKTALSLTL